jgi:hypothetical protein
VDSRRTRGIECPVEGTWNTPYRIVSLGGRTVEAERDGLDAGVPQAPNRLSREQRRCTRRRETPNPKGPVRSDELGQIASFERVAASEDEVRERIAKRLELLEEALSLDTGKLVG